MAHDRYKIKVLHHLNPHLIWVEVVDNDKINEIRFEQVGIYGVLPTTMNINHCNDVLSIQRCPKWVPAANLAMNELLKDPIEVWFSLTLINQRASIFDSNIHKFGDIIIITKSGTEHSIRNELIKSKFALHDECSFHKALTTNNIQTLNYVETLQVQHILEKRHNGDTPEHVWLNKLKSQTSLLQMAVDLDNNVIRQVDKPDINTLWENKLKLVKDCDDFDEIPLGRATNLKGIRPKTVKTGLKKKMDRLKSFHAYNAPNDHDINDSESDDAVSSKENIYRNVELINETKKSVTQHYKASICKSKDPPNMKLVAFGPPGCNPSTLKAKLLLQEAPEPSLKPIEPDLKPSEVTEIFSKEDSEVSIKITNLNKLKSKLAEAENLKQNQSANEAKSTKGIPRMLKWKLLYLREMTKDESSTQGLAKNSVENDSDDESISDIVEKLNLSNLTRKSELDIKTDSVVDNVRINVNPYRNVDGSGSVFVDKLVTPVLMVHTKKNNRLQTHCNLRDIPFGTDIHVALKNMAITAPMRLQAVSWITVLRGHSLFLISPPFSGKTIGYLPSICRLVADNKQVCDGFGPSCIIVCATANSVSDVESIARMFLHEVRIFACYAGMDEMVVTTSLLNGCDLLICTPCMLVRLLQRDFGVDLRNLSNFVLDDCERITEVYPNELKFSLIKIKEMLKIRANKEWKVQFVVASRVWCDFMTSLAKKAPDSVVCIGSFQECVLYSKTNTSVNFVQVQNKLNAVVDFLKGIDRSKMTVIVCRSDDEIHELEKALIALKYIVFSSDSAMTLHDLYKLNVALSEYEEPILGAVLICCDGNLTHLNVTNAHYLVHYSLPELFSMFCKRFSVLNDNYQSIFTNEDSNVKIKILLDDTNVEQLPKILNFVQRCTATVPDVLNKVCERILVEKDLAKAQAFVPICGNLLISGKCPDFWNCNERHSIFKDFDTPKNWMPKDGVITFNILHYNSAVSYSVRLLSNITKGTKKYPQNYNLLTVNMGLYYSKEVNKKPHGIPKVGDVCAVALKQYLYERCQIMKILKVSNKGVPELVLIKMLDAETYETTKDVYLYHLPDEFKAIETHVARVVLSNVQSGDRDVTFSELAKNSLKNITDKDDDLYLRGQVTLVVGNTIFVDTLETCQDLSSLNEVVVKHDLKEILLNGHALPNPEHIESLKRLCSDILHNDKKVETKIEVPKQLKVLPKGSWAHLDGEGFTTVCFAYIDNPGKFYVRSAKLKDCHDALMNDINKYVVDSPEKLSEFNVGDVVLAKFPDDDLYERARIDHIVSSEKVRCFFVDQGNLIEVYTKDLLAITEKFITQLPFQAIECTLAGIQPVGSDWTEFSTNWFVDNWFDTKNQIKYLFAKYFKKERAETTDGNKYFVALIDTYTEKDVIINQMMVDLNLARPNDDIAFLNEIDFKREVKVSSDDSDDENTVNEPNNKIITPLGGDKDKLIRSVPLVDSDLDSDESWDIDVPEQLVSMFNLMKTPVPISQSTESNKDTSLIISPIITSPVASKGNSTLKILPALKASSVSEGTMSVLSENKLKTTKTLQNSTSSTGSTSKSSESALNATTDSDDTSSVKSEKKSKLIKILQKSTSPTEHSMLPTLKAPIDSDDTSSITSDRKLKRLTKLSSLMTSLDSDDTASVSSEKKPKFDELRKPKLLWRQTKTAVTVKIQLIGVDNYEMVIDERSLRFFCLHHDAEYGFECNLYGGVDTEMSSHSAKGQYILVKLHKIMKRNWLSLTQGGCPKWVVYDVDGISSDEEEVLNDVDNVIKINHFDDLDSDSDDDFRADANFCYDY